MARDLVLLWVTIAFVSEVAVGDATDFSRFSKEPCETENYRCYNSRSLAYTNALRAVNHAASLQLGSENMLGLAVDHSRQMANRGNTFHQILLSLPVGCGTNLKAENVASIHRSRRGEFPDEAALCQSQWVNSAENYRSIIADDKTEAVLGLFVDKYGYVWCTQLLSSGTRFEDSGKCAHANEVDPAAEPTEIPLNAEATPEALVSSTGHVFQNEWVETEFVGGEKVILFLGCGKICRYCSPNNSICLSEKESIVIDVTANDMKNH